MSAIWGVIDLSGQPIDQAAEDKMSKCLSKYKIDKKQNLLKDNVYMACGLQYIAPWSHGEVLPLSDGDIYFTADCCLNERERLISELRDSSFAEVDLDTPDGKLLYLAFRAWGEDFGEHVEGLFSFACYDSARNEFYLFTDHTSSRCIHYYVHDKKVYFGTLTGSITDSCPEIKICDKWMSACESVDIASMILFEGLSPFEEVYMLSYGTGIKVSLNEGEVNLRKIRYYDPLSTIDEDKSITDQKAKELFLATFEACVRDALQTDKEVGILLSSGLDSTSVAGMAAHLLDKDDHKALHSYTSIPLKNFDKRYCNERLYWIDDESEGVKITCKRYPNIKPKFLDCEGVSALTKIEENVDYLEFPAKALVNSVWMNEAYAQAALDGCKVMLTGGYGNATISYGSIFKSSYRALLEGRPVQAIMQISKLGKSVKVSRKTLFKRFFDLMICNEALTDEYLFSDEAFKKELLDKYGVRQAWKVRSKKEGGRVTTKKQFRSNVISPFLLQLLGLYDTKNGLFNGIVIKDPTRDKRILELCLRLPYRCFAWDTQERRLAREYMADYIPGEIRSIRARRGRQSGDAVLRYESFGLPSGQEPWEAIDAKMERYFDLEKVKKTLMEETSNDNLDQKMKLLSCSFFLKGLPDERFECLE